LKGSILQEIVFVHPRVCKKHPELSEDGIVEAWLNRLRMTRRVDTFADNYVAVGFDQMGRLLQMVAAQTDAGWTIFHAMPATKKALDELGKRRLMLVRQIPSQFAPDPFGRTTPLLEVMAPFARTELGQIGRKMACND
jgi:hypothetical protein